MIVWMWAKKNVASVFSAMPVEQATPLVVTTLVITSLKIVAMAVGVLCIKWIANKISRK